MEILKAGAPARKKLDAIEADIAQIQRRALDVETAPRAVPAVLADIARQVEDAANAPGRSVVNRLGDCLFSAVRDHRAGSAQLYREPLTLADLWLLMGKDTLMDALSPIVKARASSFHKQGISDEARAEQLKTIHHQLREAGIAAEREAMQLEAAGHTVLRRDDADVAALFETWAACDPAAVGAAAPAGDDDGPSVFQLARRA